jgi:hypothetical protein
MSAVSRLGRSLGIETGEGRVFAWGATTLFLIGWASVSLANVSETFFLKRVGVDRLPAVFLLNTLLLVGTTYLMSRLAAGRSRRQVLAGTFAVLGMFALVLWLLVLAKFPGVYVLLVIASKQLDAIALIVFWIVLGGLLHGRQAKRLYAPIIAGGTLGRILGSFASGGIGKAFGIPALLPVAAIAIGLASLLAAQMRSVVPVRVTPITGRRATGPPPAVLQKFGPLWRDNRLFRLLAVSALLGGCLGPMLYFQFSYVVDLATRGSNGEMRLLELYAKVRGGINAGVLCMQLIGTTRVFRRIGVPLASTLSPLVYLIGFFGVSTRLDLASGIGAVAGANLQDHAIQEPAQRILATLFPERLRAAATSLIEGPVQRFGGALGNVLVLSALAISGPAWIGFAALPLAAFWLLIAIDLWRIYPTVLIEVATAGPMHADVALSLPELMDPGTLRVLSASLIDPDPRRCRAACALVIEAPRGRAIAALARAISQAPAANRPILVETLHSLLERSPHTPDPVPEAAADLEPVLIDAAALPAVERAQLVEVYASLVAPLRSDAPATQVLNRLVTDPTPAVRLAATVSLQRAGLLPGAGPDLDAILTDALASEDSAVRHVALEALRTASLATEISGRGDSVDAVRWDARIALIAARLDDAYDRACAAQVLAAIAVHRGPQVAACADQVLAYVHDHDPHVRAAVLRFVGHAGLKTHIVWVIGRLASDDETEAAAAAEALRLLGPGAIDALLAALRRNQRAVREAVLPILHDVYRDASALRGLIDGEIQSVRRMVLQLHGLRAGPVSRLVLQRLDERIAEGLHTTLLLLATLQHEDQIAALGDLLARSRDGRGRAVLLEALEAVLPPAERVRLIPLLEGGSSAAAAAAAARALGRPLPSFDDAVRETANDPDPLTRSFLAATLGASTLKRVGGTVEPSGGMASVRDLKDHATAPGGMPEARMLNRVEIILHLRSLDLFARLTTRELSELADVVREETYPAGAMIVREGEFGDCMYLVVEGEMRVTREGKFVARLKQEEFFGEMALFDGETRFATVTATTRLRLLRLERHDLLELMDAQPGIAIAICQTLSRHVRDLINRVEGRGGKDESEA